MKKLISLSLLFFLLGRVGASSVQAQNSDRVSGQILVKFKQGTSKEESFRQVRAQKAQVLDKLEVLDVLVLRVPKILEGKVISTLARNPLVEYAEPDYQVEAFFLPNDTYFSQRQWGFENTGQIINGVLGVIDADIDVPDAWDIIPGGVKVAVLDTGISQNHQELSSKVVNAKDFTGSGSGYEDVYGHGTHVAGIVAALTDNNMGVAGGCPGCELMNGKVLNDRGSGAYSWVANGIVWASDNGAKVINLSLGGSQKSLTLERA